MVDTKKDELTYELEQLKQKRVIKRYDTNFNSFTDKYDIWVKWADGHASTFNGINSIDDFKRELASALPVKKSYKCHLCRNYIPECDGCRRGYYNSLFIPCPDFRSKEFPPTDKEATEALKSIIKDTRMMVGPEAEAHKYADELASYILQKNGYHKGIEIFNTIDKGYEGIEGDEEYLEYDDVLPWQCLLCRKQKTYEGGCIDGLDEGWEMRNNCAYFSHVEFPMQPDEFIFFMDSIREESRGEYAECTDEVVHYNMDKLMMIVLNSLGYSKFARLYEDMDKHYLSVPF